jgi:DNA-binding NarL/FixJ family response regulator
VSTRELQIVIVEDHLAVRKGVELLLRSEGMRVIGVAETPAAGARMIAERKPDVAIIDIMLGDESGLDVARAVLADDPDAGILMYTAEEGEPIVREALECGARGFALKSGAPDELLAAIRAVEVDATSAVHASTPREREIMHALAIAIRLREIELR